MNNKCVCFNYVKIEIWSTEITTSSKKKTLIFMCKMVLRYLGISVYQQMQNVSIFSPLASAPRIQSFHDVENFPQLQRKHYQQLNRFQAKAFSIMTSKLKISLLTMEMPEDMSLYTRVCASSLDNWKNQDSEKSSPHFLTRAGRV